ncbi:MAG: hypothetical protein ABII22_02075 [Candidatus Micrarchaeota archaeon]
MIKNLLRQTSVIFLLALVFAFVSPGFSTTVDDYLTPLLIVAMTFSIVEVKFDLHTFIKGKAYLARAFFFNYVVCTGVTLLLTYLLIQDPDTFKGMVLFASIPSAVGVLSYSKILKGNGEYVLNGQIILYLASLVLMPLIVYSILGTSVDTSKLVESLFLMILLPLIFSRIVRRMNIKNLAEYEKIIINIAFFFVFYAVLGPNMDKLVLSSLTIALFMVFFFRKFIVGTIVFFADRYLKVPKDIAVDDVLFSTYKNEGLAVALAMALAGPVAVFPGAIVTIVSVFLFIYLEQMFKMY